MALNSYNIIVEQGIDGYLISSVIELPGCHTPAEIQLKVLMNYISEPKKR
jgi:hypothetical protein